TRVLFWDGPRSLERRSDDRDDTWAGIPCPNFHATPVEERLGTTCDLACNRHHTQRIFSGIGCRALRPQSRGLTTRPPWPGPAFSRLDRLLQIGPRDFGAPHQSAMKNVKFLIRTRRSLDGPRFSS
ncbi:hypothetical protein AVEN_177468-1, partial [Araneus ventricosus]